MPDTRFERFLSDTATLSWPSVDAIAARGRQRRARRRAATGLAAAAVAVGLVVAGTSMRGASGPTPAPPATQQASAPVSAGPSATTAPPVTPSGQPSGSPPSSAPTALTRVPVAAMLRPADAGPAAWKVVEEDHGDWAVEFDLSMCEAARNIPYIAGIDDRTRTMSPTPGEPGPVVTQQVMLFAPGRASAHVANLRAKVRACAAFTARFADNQPYEMRILADGFAAADESFVIEVRTGGAVFLHAIVRVGALFTEVVMNPHVVADITRVGRAAARRLAEAGG